MSVLLPLPLLHTALDTPARPPYIRVPATLCSRCPRRSLDVAQSTFPGRSLQAPGLGCGQIHLAGSLRPFAGARPGMTTR
jgi:hypothetical protein